MRKLSVLALGLILAGCGGGGGGSSTAAADPTMTVTPSLGRFSEGALVELWKPAGAAAFASGRIASNGSVTISVGSYAGAVIIKVIGAAATGSIAKVTYYDEKDDTLKDFGAGEVLRAVVPAPQNKVGVTSLTNAAVSKLEVATGNLNSIGTSTIKEANAQVAAAFGLPDILEAPNPVNAKPAAGAGTLNIATPADKYALVLAALAKTSGVGSNAAAVAKTLALDMSDGKLDGQQKLFGETAASAVPTPAYVPASFVADLKTQYTAAATVFADASSKLVVDNQPLAVVTDVTTVVAKDNQSDISLAKALFAELRTTLKSFSNGLQTGSLDKQVKSARDDLAANVAPDIERVANRVAALRDAAESFENAKSTPTAFVAGTKPGTTDAALTRTYGSLKNVWSGNGGFTNCWTDGAAALNTTLTCAVAGSDSAVKDGNNSSTGAIRMMVFELKKNGTKYDYTATRRNVAVTGIANGIPTLGATTMPLIDAGTGTISTPSATDFAAKGTLPPSKSNSTNTGVLTGVDTIDLNGTRTSLVGNSYRYAVNGSISTVDAKPTGKTTSVSLDSGSYVDQTDNSATTGERLASSAKLIGTFKTNLTKFVGTVELTNWSLYADGLDNHPNDIVFTGAISDVTPTTGAGEFLTGKLEAKGTNATSYYPKIANSPTNYLKGSLTFTGAVKATDRPDVSLVLGLSTTSHTTRSVTATFGYGNKKLTGSGTADDNKPADDTITLSDQNGIVIALNTRTEKGTVKKSDKSIATLSTGRIDYDDMTSESLN